MILKVMEQINQSDRKEKLQISALAIISVDVVTSREANAQ